MKREQERKERVVKREFREWGKGVRQFRRINRESFREVRLGEDRYSREA